MISAARDLRRSQWLAARVGNTMPTTQHIDCTRTLGSFGNFLMAAYLVPQFEIRDNLITFWWTLFIKQIRQVTLSPVHPPFMRSGHADSIITCLLLIC